MSVVLYDKAFIAKLKNITENTPIHVYSPNDARRLFEIQADETNDSPLKLPLIVLSHPGGYSIRERGNTPRSKSGIIIPACKEQVGYIDPTFIEPASMDVMPISIPYQIDIYSRLYEEADAIARELVFILTNNPKLKVIIPYNSVDYLHYSNVILDSEVRDNSSIQERLIPGQFTRFTIECSIPDAYLFDVRLNDYVHINIMDPEIIVADTYNSNN